MLRIAVCDDDETSLQAIKKLVAQTLKEEYVLTSFHSGLDLMLYLSEQVKGQLDIAILDIDLGEGQNGIELAKRLNRDYPRIKIIFCTGFIEFSQDVYDSEAVYFLVKPIKAEKMQNALSRALLSLNTGKKETLQLKTEGNILNLNVAEIRYIESLRRQISIVGEEGALTCYAKLSEVLARLPFNFIRCHKSYIVNLNFVQALGRDEFVLSRGERVPISRAQYEEVKRAFLSYLGDRL